jgi:hypothetical protein
MTIGLQTQRSMASWPPGATCFLMEEEVWQTRHIRADRVETRCFRKLAARRELPSITSEALFRSRVSSSNRPCF